MPQIPLKKPAKGGMSTQLQFDESLSQVAVTIRFSNPAMAREYARQMAQTMGPPVAEAILTNRP